MDCHCDIGMDQGESLPNSSPGRTSGKTGTMEEGERGEGSWQGWSSSEPGGFWQRGQSLRSIPYKISFNWVGKLPGIVSVTGEKGGKEERLGIENRTEKLIKFLTKKKKKKKAGLETQEKSLGISSEEGES